MLQLILVQLPMKKLIKQKKTTTNLTIVNLIMFN
jgi:hypothetical protein